ncbi:Aste57867_18420 [Aphanomyces stellatus]|uniref:Aste57867_18420 protein n=1 Tax=Aphanomyces stellatus TaxID=120398 RepID=A0A485LAM5_9STRA|nr:hypothetical protein As57867_018358 [Aphanomyces stellatus]VFT95156.1 Aste57867_18420 [Aphanomyces stellatus]
MRTRSRTRALREAKESPPMNITVNIHIHITQDKTATSLPSHPPPQPQHRYFTRLQRQRASTYFPPQKQIHPPPSASLKQIAPTVHDDHTSTTLHRRPVVEKPKPKRRRIDMDSLMADLTCMTVAGPVRDGVRPGALPSAQPHNPFQVYTPPTDTSMVARMSRCELSADATADLAVAIESMALSATSDAELDATLAQLTSLSLHAPRHHGGESVFLHHLMAKRLSLHGE